MLAGTTNSVMLCCGSVAAMAPLEIRTSASFCMELDAVSCQTCADDPAANWLRLRETGVEPLRYLLTTMTVNAPSLDRTAANAATLSGSGTVADTLVSPNADFAPS